MIAEIICVSLSCLIVSLFLTAVIAHCGVPTSISATYYNTQKKWLMPVCIGVAGALTLVPFFNHTPEQWKFTAFLIVASIMFIACAPAFKDDLEGKVHKGAALVLGVTSLVWLFLITGFPWIALIGFILAGLNRKKYLFWCEVGILYNLYASLLYIIAE